MTLEKKQVGLKMLDLSLFIKALKITWTRRFFQGGKISWAAPLNISSGSNIPKILSLGPEYLQCLKKKFKNKFWIEIFDATYEILQNQNFLNDHNILTTPLWYNRQIFPRIALQRNT